MKQINYVYDLRPQLTADPDDLIRVSEMTGLDLTNFCYEDKHRYNIPLHTLKVGHVLYLIDFHTLEEHKVVVVHKYADVYFFKYLDGDNAGKVEYLPEGCFSFQCLLYPETVAIPKGYKMSCRCERTKIVTEYDGKTITKKRQEIY